MADQELLLAEKRFRQAKDALAKATYDESIKRQKSWHEYHYLDNEACEAHRVCEQAKDELQNAQENLKACQLRTQNSNLVAQQPSETPQ